MACEKCGCSKISDGYKCNLCLIEDKEFEYIVITKTYEGEGGNIADDVIKFNRNAMLEIIQNEFTLKDAIKERRKYTKFDGDDCYNLFTKCEVFSQGELLTVDPYFGRDLFNGRCPRKWSVEYETFRSDQLIDAAKLSKKVIDGEF